MTNSKTIFKQKSKFLLTILCLLGLAFSYSCSCRDDGPGYGTGGKFKVSEADNNTKSAIVKSTMSGEDLIKINLSANKEYSFTFEVNHDETDETKKITTDDFTQKSGGISSKDSLATKVKAWDTANGPNTKTIRITFTVSADDTTSTDAIQNISVDIKLTHAQKIDEEGLKKIIKKGETVVDNDKNIPPNKFSFDFPNANYASVGKEFTVVNKSSDNLDISKSRLRNFTKYNLVDKTEEISNAELTKEDGGKEDSSFYTLTYKITYAPNYESELTEIQIKYENKSSKIKFIE